MRTLGMRLVFVFVLGAINVVFAPSSLCADIGQVPEVRKTLTLDSDWRFMRSDIADGGAVSLDDSGWQPISLPHSVNADSAMNGKTHRGAAWYRRLVTLTKSAVDIDKHTYLEFDGAALATDVWINGAKVGHHDGGFARFRFDITPYIKLGSNVVAVRVDNSKVLDIAPLGGDYTLFGGLYRNVRLVTTQDVHVDMQDYGSSGVTFTAKNVTPKSAALTWMVRLANDRERAAKVHLIARLVDAQHTAVATVSKVVDLPPHGVTPISLDARLDIPHLWQGVADPYLYDSEIELVTDAAQPVPLDHIVIPVGIRDIRIDADKGLLINGQVVSVHGVNIHQTILPGKGSAVSDADIDADYQMLGDLGVTGLRFAHYQHAAHGYDLADQKGYLVWTELPMSSQVNGSEAFQINITQQLRELIRQNINHPSVFVWGLGNEIYKVDDVSARLLDAMHKLAHEEDPSRATTYANCCSEIDGPQASHSDVIGSNVYFGWYNGNFADLGPWIDKNHSRRPATAEAISEYGAGASVLQQEDPPLRPKPASHWHPEQYQALYHEAAWKQLEAKPWLWATFIWVGFDFPSAGRNEGDRAGINDKGLITFDRTVKKDAYFWYQSNWTAKPLVYITSRRNTERSVADVDVKIYSNQPSVSVRLNGVDQGTQAVVGHIALWHVKLTPGRNHIEAVAEAASDNIDWLYQPQPQHPPPAP